MRSSSKPTHAHAVAEQEPYLWLKDEFIQRSIQHILEKTSDPSGKRLIINFFKNDVKVFLAGIIKSVEEIQSGQGHQQEMSGFQIQLVTKYPEDDKAVKDYKIIELGSR